MRVYAVEDRLLPRLGIPGRFVARDASKAPLLEGEDVVEDVYYLRALRDGDLTTAAPKLPAKPSPAEKEPA